MVHVRLCVPWPHVTEQLLHALQPPSTGAAAAPKIVDEMRILALMKRSALVLPMAALLLWRGTVRRARNRALLGAA